MIKTGWTAFLVVALAGVMLAATPATAQKKLGGVGAPQAVKCSDSGGTMNGTMCDLPSGRSCEAMTFARDGQCVDASGNIVPEVELEEDFGTNDGSDTSGDGASNE